MDHKESDKVLAFDTLYTSNQIAILKILHSMFDDEDQPKFVVLIKYMEFQYALSLSSKRSSQITSCSKNNNKPDFLDLIEDIKLYCSPNQKQQLDQIGNLQNTMSMMEEMKSMMEMMNAMQENTTDNNGDCGSEPNNDSNNMLDNDMIKSMLSPEQLAMFEMFKGGF